MKNLALAAILAAGTAAASASTINFETQLNGLDFNYDGTSRVLTAATSIPAFDGAAITYDTGDSSTLFSSSLAGYTVEFVATIGAVTLDGVEGTASADGSFTFTDTEGDTLTVTFTGGIFAADDVNEDPFVLSVPSGVISYTTSGSGSLAGIDLSSLTGIDTFSATLFNGGDAISGFEFFGNTSFGGEFLNVAYTGTAIPAPMAAGMGALGLGLLGARRRRA